MKSWRVAAAVAVIAGAHHPAFGATSAASRSSAHLERISWKEPIADVRDQDPEKQGIPPGPKRDRQHADHSRIPLGIVTVFARRMLA